MAPRFTSPIYNVTLANGKKVAIDVTNSISAGLEPNSGLMDHLVPWMEQRGYTRVLDFGGGALRHSIPLLKAGLEVTAVEYERAYQRPRAKEALEAAQEYDGFTALVWPHEFMRSRLRFDVALLLFVLQVIPRQVERQLVLDTIGQHFHRDGPRRLFYASRYGASGALRATSRYNDGWVMGRGKNDRSFYTEWNASETNQILRKSGFERMGRYEGASQSYIYDFRPGIL